MTDLMLVLNTDAAVAAFASSGGGQVTLGAEMGVALGPVGRRMGASVTSGAVERNGKASNVSASGGGKGNALGPVFGCKAMSPPMPI